MKLLNNALERNQHVVVSRNLYINHAGTHCLKIVQHIQNMLFVKNTCISCFGSFHQAQIVTFNTANYNCNSNMVKRLLGMNREQCNGYVCKQCDKKLL